MSVGNAIGTNTSNAGVHNRLREEGTLASAVDFSGRNGRRGKTGYTWLARHSDRGRRDLHDRSRTLGGAVPRCGGEASSNGGQFLIVVLEPELVVVATAGNDGQDRVWRNNSPHLGET